MSIGRYNCEAVSLGIRLPVGKQLEHYLSHMLRTGCKGE